MTGVLPDPRRGATRAAVLAALAWQWRLVATGIAATLVGAAGTVIGPSMVRHGIDEGMRGGDAAAVRFAAVGYLASLAASGIAAGVQTSAMAVAAERFMDRLRVDALAGLLRLPVPALDRTKRGDLLARVTADTEALSGAARFILPDVVRLSVDLAASIVAVALLDVRLGLLALVAVPPMVAAGRALRRRAAIVYPAYRQEVGRLVGDMTETIQGASTVRSLGAQGRRLAALDAANGAVTARYLDGTAMRNRFYLSITLTRVACTALVLVMATLLAAEGSLSIGTAAAGVLAVTAVFRPLAWLTELLDDALSARSALDRVVAAATIEPERPGVATLPDRGDLVFRGVDFAYRPGVPVLRDVSVTIPWGAHTALVGATGAGKSTFARLAAGVIEPDSGVITFGGVDIAAASTEERRRRLLFVPQETLCVSGTVADNLRLADTTATDEELLAALRDLGLGDWITSHPDGLARDVGPGGSHLSIGERQLIGLSRVVLRDPAVVILDESTSALDGRTEGLVGEALSIALRHRTVLVIAHRPETASRAADRLLVADHGVTRASDGAPRP